MHTHPCLTHAPRRPPPPPTPTPPHQPRAPGCRSPRRASSFRSCWMLWGTVTRWGCFTGTSSLKTCCCPHVRARGLAGGGRGAHTGRRPSPWAPRGPALCCPPAGDAHPAALSPPPSPPIRPPAVPRAHPPPPPSADPQPARSSYQTLGWGCCLTTRGARAARCCTPRAAPPTMSRQRCWQSRATWGGQQTSGRWVSALGGWVGG